MLIPTPDADFPNVLAMRSLINMPLVPNTTIKPESNRMAGNVRMSGRTSGSPPVINRHPFVHFGNLIDEAEALVRAEFIGSSTGFGGGVKVAVIAFEVASLGEIQCHEVRLEIVNGATIVRSRQWRRRGDELEICC